jgi:hypothetical protein
MPETTTAPRGGLFTKEDAPVPLAGVAIDAAISTLCARVTVTQRFVNREQTPIEAVYVFPLDEGAAVCGFEAIIDGTLVVGEVKERETAFKMYDEAMEQGHGAYLLDEERPDVFQASVGNLPPGKEVLLKLTYVTELAVEGGAVRFAIPTTVSPRYAPAEDRIGVGRPDSETLNPPVAWRVPYGLDLTVRVSMTGAIRKIDSTSHPVSVSMDGNNATVTLSQREAALDRDFVLSVEAAGLDTPRGWIEKDDDGTEAVAVAFAPTFPDASTPAEIVFLVDRSGSMEGQSIAEVRNALQLCLRSMIPGCSFNIVGFGSTFESLFEKSRPYDERSLADASEHVARLGANLGGTEILPALKHVLEQPRHAGLTRQVVILTDGEVSNTDALLALAAEHANDARIFTFGIGAGASHHLVKGVARAGRGVAEFIYPGERIEAKVVRQFGRLLSPALTDVRLAWHGIDVTQAPSTIPPIFSGGRLLVYGFLKGQRGPVRATLSANAASGPVSFDVAIDAADVRSGRTVVALAARTRIRELEESPAWTRTRGSRQSDRKKSSVTAEIVALSTRYGLISRETSFVAIERRDTPVEGEIQLRRVPIALASGWGGLEIGNAAPPPAATPSFLRVSASADLMSLEDTFDDMPSSQLSSADPSERYTARARASAGSAIARGFGRFFPGRAKPPAPLVDAGADALRTRMYRLVNLQRADGSWELTDEHADAIGRELRDVKSALANVTGDAEENHAKAWATALALAWLRRDASDLEAEWKMLASKGEQWLATHAVRPIDGPEWIQRARAFLAA